MWNSQDDAVYAEACGAAEVQPQRIVIGGDNQSVIDFLINMDKLRRAVVLIADVVETVQHLMAFSLLSVNRCADFLGIARNHAREHFAPIIHQNMITFDQP